MPDYYNIVMKNNAWKNISFETHHSVSMEKKNPLRSQALTAERFQLAKNSLVDKA